MIGEILAWLLQHLDLITLIREALEGGVSKQELVEHIKKTMTEAARKQLEMEFPRE